jgi:paraquat-inducible protein B
VTEPASQLPATAATPAPIASGLAMKRRNPIAIWLVLPLITLGIYHLVWYYKIHKVPEGTQIPLYV